MSSITVTNLQKTFQTKRKAGGLRGSLRALVRPEYTPIAAVRGLSFQMEAGELLGFIGPNGAEVLKIGHYGVKLSFDTRQTPVEKVLAHLTDIGNVVDITVSAPPLEEVIAEIYKEARARPVN